MGCCRRKEKVIEGLGPFPALVTFCAYCQAHKQHSRQRKALTPAFSNVAIRKLTHVFFDSAYKVRSALSNLFRYYSNFLPVQRYLGRYARYPPGGCCDQHTGMVRPMKRHYHLRSLPNLTQDEQHWVSYRQHVTRPCNS